MRRCVHTIGMVLGLALLCFALSGCSGPVPGAAAPAEPSQPAEPDGEMPSPDAVGCSTDLECAQDEICDGEVCRSGACNRERECPDGQSCDRDTFTCSGGDEPACRENRDCEGIAICEGGSCNEVACVEDSHCEDDETCSDQNRCVQTLGECLDADGDGFGQECPAGDDCDDTNAMINPAIPEDLVRNCGDGIDNNCDGVEAPCGETDNDEDGSSSEEDCDDNNPMINPQATEIPYNGVDEDCNPDTRDDDVDGDGYPMAEDCDDREVTINPEATDIPGNGVDEDCDGMDRVPLNEDGDGDGVTEADGDCNDEDAAINPGADEVPYNGRDDDCNPETPDNDLDGDGFEQPADCNDDDSAINPGAEEINYNNVDEDCNPETSDSDRDGDGFDGTEGGGEDCNDDAAGVNPGAEEVPYNNQDDDCNAETRDDDLDGDGFPRATDCDDNEAMINPDIVEDAATNCSDDIDHDCRGGDVMCDEGAEDSDGDGVPDDQDCAPENADIPGAEEIPNNGLDDDCNPETPDEVEVCEDDAFDMAAPNNSPETATAVEDANRVRGQFGALAICDADRDWYRIDLAEGDGLEIDITFMHSEGDVDMRLERLEENGGRTFIASSTSRNDFETVYERRAPVAATYLVSVYRFNDRPGRSAYTMNVNVFSQCSDDTPGATSEHNDEASQAKPLPTMGEMRQICDYDEDWYSFTLTEPGNVRLDLIFTHRLGGDIDMALHAAGETSPMRSARSTSDNELIELQLETGTYNVRVWGVGAAQNSYQLFRTSGQIETERQQLGEVIAIPDAMGGVFGVAEAALTFDVPAGALIRNLRVRDLDVNHDFLRDLFITGLWNGEQRVVLWNRQGDSDGNDGGEDDDFLPFTGGDINFDNRDYSEFAGLSAQGTFTLRVEDRAGGDDGEIADLDVEIEYFLP